MFAVAAAAAPPLERARPVTRIAGWEHALTRWINTAQSKKFTWSDWDCCTAMADAVQAIAGVDVADRVRGHYTTALGASIAVMRLHPGVSTFEDCTAAELTHHGLVECKVAEARRGDVVAFDQPPPTGVTWGVVDLTGRRAVGASKRGLLWVPVLNCRRAWHVG